MKEAIVRQPGEPSINNPPCRVWTDGTKPLCGSLIEIRKEIDDIDAQIRSLLGKRLAMTNDAVRFKQDTNEVPAPARQKEVITNAVGHATELQGLYPVGYVELVEATTKVVMDFCIRLQGRAISRTRLTT